MDLLYIKKRIKDKLESEPTGHDFYHALRVMENAKIIAKDYRVDLDVIYASCLVHDVIDDKLEEMYILSLDEVKDVLRNASLSSIQIEKVLDIITNMSYRSKNSFTYLEGQIVQDADRLDALGAIGIARTFAFGGSRKRNIYDDKGNVLTSVGHFYDKLFKLEGLMNTKSAKKIAKKRTEFMNEFINQLKEEAKIEHFRIGDRNGEL